MVSGGGPVVKEELDGISDDSLLVIRRVVSRSVVVFSCKACL